jgi:tetratricopeptide (TPR) repeat protein
MVFASSGGFMAVVPPFGLYRIIQAYRQQKANGTLAIKGHDFEVVFGLQAGVPKCVFRASPPYSLEDYLIKSRSISEVHLNKVLEKAQQGQSSSCLVLLKERHLEPEVIKTAQESLVSSVLESLMPLELEGFTYSAEQVCNSSCPCNVVDPMKPLVRAIKTFDFKVVMQSAVERFFLSETLIPSDEYDPLLEEAKRSFGDSRVVFLARQTRFPEIPKVTSKDPVELRVAFFLVVTRAWQKKPIETPAPEPSHLSEVATALKPVVSEMRTKNHYQILQCPPDATLFDCIQGIEQLRKKYALNKYQGNFEDAREFLFYIHQRIEEAHRTLLNRDLRLAYNKNLGIETPGLVSTVANLFDAEALFEQGMAEYNRQHYREAEDAFLEATKREPRDPRYAVWFAKALMAQAFSRDVNERALAVLNKVIEERRDFAMAYATLGEVYRRLGQRKEAEDCCAKALSLDPENDDAKRTKSLLKKREMPSTITFRKEESVVKRILGAFKGSKKED